MFNWKKVKKDKQEVQEVQETTTKARDPKTRPFYTNVTTKACRFCGKVFVPEHIAEQYCSEECKNEAKRANQRIYNREYYAKTHPGCKQGNRLDEDGLPKARTCVQCGKTFYPKYGCQKTCSEECKKASRLAYKREWNRKNREAKRESARKWYYTDKERKLAEKQNETKIIEEETMDSSQTKKKYTSEEYTRKIRNKTRYIIDTLRQLDKTGLDEEIIFEAINNINRMPLDNFDKK